MKPLDFYLRPQPPLAAYAWLLPVMLAVAATVAMLEAVRLESRTADLRLRSGSLQASAAARAAVKPPPVDAEQQKRWAKVQAERSFRWEDVFAAVERSDRNNIELLGFEPEKETRLIVLRGEAQDRDALSAYLAALSEQPMLSHVHLVHMQQVVRDRLETVSFDIKATVRR